jgi:hypothetical protein
LASRGLRPFDVVYAINYVPRPDYFDQKLTNKRGSFTEKPYLVAMELVRATNLASPTKDTPLVIMSHENDIVSLMPGAIESSFVKFRSISELVYNIDLIDTFYLNTCVNSLIINLEYFRSVNKWLLISDAIVLKSDRASLELLLDRYGLSYGFINDANVLSRFESEPETNFLVVDYMAFDEMVAGASSSGLYKKRPNVAVVRMEEMDINIPSGCTHSSS